MLLFGDREGGFFVSQLIFKMSMDLSECYLKLEKLQPCKVTHLRSDVIRANRRCFLLREGSGGVLETCSVESYVLGNTGHGLHWVRHVVLPPTSPATGGSFDGPGPVIKFIIMEIEIIETIFTFMASKILGPLEVLASPSSKQARKASGHPRHIELMEHAATQQQTGAVRGTKPNANNIKR